MVSSKETIWWTFLAVAVPSAIAMLWWFMEKGFNSVAPFQVLMLQNLSAEKTCMTWRPRKAAYASRLGRHMLHILDSFWGRCAQMCQCAVEVQARHPLSAAGQRLDQARAAPQRCVTWCTAAAAMLRLACLPSMHVNHWLTRLCLRPRTCQGVHGRLLRHDALWPHQCPSPGVSSCPPAWTASVTGTGVRGGASSITSELSLLVMLHHAMHCSRGSSAAYSPATPPARAKHGV